MEAPNEMMKEAKEEMKWVNEMIWFANGWMKWTNEWKGGEN
jgi:hypothetical protein